MGAWTQSRADRIKLKGGEVDLSLAREATGGAFQLMLGLPPTGKPFSSQMTTMLQWLTRKLTILAPSAASVTEAALLALGFGDAREASRKMDTLTSLLEGHLVPLEHYQFGHRLLPKLVPYIRDNGAMYQVSSPRTSPATPDPDLRPKICVGQKNAF